MVFMRPQLRVPQQQYINLPRIDNQSVKQQSLLLIGIFRGNVFIPVSVGGRQALFSITIWILYHVFSLVLSQFYMYLDHKLWRNTKERHK